jgi:hypothetical protein
MSKSYKDLNGFGCFILNTFIRKDVNIGSTYKYSIIIQDLTKNYVKTGICHPPVNKNHSVRVMVSNATFNNT